MKRSKNRQEKSHLQENRFGTRENRWSHILGDRKGVTSIKKLMDQEIDVTKYKDFLLEDDLDYRKSSLKESVLHKPS